MRKFILGLTVLFLGASANSVFAKDICASGVVGLLPGTLLRFEKVKLLNGKTTPLVGRADINGNNVPFAGALTVDSDGVTVRIAVTAYQVPGSWNVVGFTMNLVGDKNFNATGFFDNFPLNGNGDGALQIANSDCSSFPPAFPIREAGKPSAGILE